MRTFLCDSPKCEVQAKTLKEARSKIEKKHKTKELKNLRLENEETQRTYKDR